MKHMIIITTVGGVILSIDHKPVKDLAPIVPYLNWISESNWNVLMVTSFVSHEVAGSPTRMQYTLIRDREYRD